MGAGIVRRKATIELPVLSSRHGGSSGCRSYCLYFQERPGSLRGSLCSGCPDRERCADNSPPPLRMVWLNVG